MVAPPASVASKAKLTNCWRKATPTTAGELGIANASCAPPLTANCSDVTSGCTSSAQPGIAVANALASGRLAGCVLPTASAKAANGRPRASSRSVWPTHGASLV
ncbi:MAG: hypothetical protein ACK56S_15035, partial [Planctomycetota bacterium]